MLTSEQVLDRYFLDTRCMLIEIGATLDRYDRAASADQEPLSETRPRLEQIYRGLALLADHDAAPNRSERLLQLFSDSE